MVQPCKNDLNCDVHAAMHLCTWLLAFGAITLGVTGFGPLQCDLSVLVSEQAASSHTHTEDSAHTDSQKEQLQCAGHEPVCLVPGSVDTCMCLTAPFKQSRDTHSKGFLLC